MSDIVSRIRSRPNDAPMPTERLLDDAAAAIERLSADNERLARNNDRMGWVMLAAMEVVRSYTANQPISDEIDRLRATLQMSKRNRVKGLQKAPEDT